MFRKEPRGNEFWRHNTPKITSAARHHTRLLLCRRTSTRCLFALLVFGLRHRCLHYRRRRRRRVFRPTPKLMSSFSSVQPPNDLCPITREQVEPDKEFCFNRQGNHEHAVRFDAGTLIDYMLTSGDYCDPESRIRFSTPDLERLDQIGKRLNKPSVVQSRQSFSESDAKFRVDALFGLERVCGDLVAVMFDLVEEVNANTRTFDEACYDVDNILIPDFADCLCQLMETDFQFGMQTAQAFEQFLRGPPNRRIAETPIQVFVLDAYKSAVDEARIVSQVSNAIAAHNKA